MNILKRIELLEYQINLNNEKNTISKPYGKILGVNIEYMIDWFNSLLYKKSYWHNLNDKQKFEVTMNYCFNPGFVIPIYAKDIERDLRSCVKALFELEAKLLINKINESKVSNGEFIDDDLEIKRDSLYSEYINRNRNKLGLN